MYRIPLFSLIYTCSRVGSVGSDKEQAGNHGCTHVLSASQPNTQTTAISNQLKPSSV